MVLPNTGDVRCSSGAALSAFGGGALLFAVALELAAQAQFLLHFVSSHAHVA